MDEQMQYRVYGGPKPETPEDQHILCLTTRDRIMHNARVIGSHAIGEVLTLVEIALPAGSQCSALKQSIKAALNRSISDNQADILNNCLMLFEDLGMDACGDPACAPNTASS